MATGNQKCYFRHAVIVVCNFYTRFNFFSRKKLPVCKELNFISPLQFVLTITPYVSLTLQYFFSDPSRVQSRPELVTIKVTVSLKLKLKTLVLTSFGLRIKNLIYTFYNDLISRKRVTPAGYTLFFVIMG